MKVYIAGKITGNPDYQEQFKAAEKELTIAGHKVMNPAILPEGFKHEEYMHICLAMIDICEAVYFLSNWRESSGACIEYGYAKGLGKEILHHI
jgi:nucleoside 2-deoxyribosyltransferase